MDLSTPYLGLKLATPLVVGASPFGDDVHTARQIEDAGAGALVMRSLFEEQIALPAAAEYQLTPDAYLRQIASLKSALTIPVIASLNGCKPGGWIDFGARFAAAGADAIELNLYNFSTDPSRSSLEIETELLETVRLLKASVRIPVAVKLQPYFTSPAHFARELERAGAGGIVVFNRVYQSDFEVDAGEPVPNLRLSDPTELLLRLRWVALLSSQTGCSLAVTGGVQNAKDAIKALLAGAHAVQLVSVLLENGPRFLTTIVDGLQQWMDRHGYRNLADFRGQANRSGAGDAAALERSDYQRLLQLWRI